MTEAFGLASLCRPSVEAIKTQNQTRIKHPESKRS